MKTEQDIEIFEGSKEFNASLLVETDEETGELFFPNLDHLTKNNPMSCIAYIKDNLAAIETVSNRIKELEKLKQILSNKVDWAKKSLYNLMSDMNITSLESNDKIFKASIYKERDISVEVDDISLIPQEFLYHTENILVSKSKIKKEILSGNNIPGVHIVKKDRFKIF